MTTTNIITAETLFETSINESPFIDEQALAAEVARKVQEARGISDASTTTIEVEEEETATEEQLAVHRMDPTDKRYPAPVRHHRGANAPSFWYVGSEALLHKPGLGLVMGERQGLEQEGDSGYKNARTVISELAPRHVLVLGNKHTPVKEYNRQAKQYEQVRPGADAILAQLIGEVPSYKGIVLVLGTALTKQIIEHYRIPLLEGKLLIISFIDPEAFEQKGSLKSAMERSAFVAAHCQDVLIVEVSDQNSGSWNTATMTTAFGHRLHVVRGKSVHKSALNETIIDFFKGRPVSSYGDLRSL